MQAASQNGHVDVLKLLLKHNVDLEAEVGVINNKYIYITISHLCPYHKCILIYYTVFQAVSQKVKIQSWA